jgi:hypothetical protein
MRFKIAWAQSKNRAWQCKTGGELQFGANALGDWLIEIKCAGSACGM